MRIELNRIGTKAMDLSSRANEIIIKSSLRGLRNLRGSGKKIALITWLDNSSR